MGIFRRIADAVSHIFTGRALPQPSEPKPSIEPPITREPEPTASLSVLRGRAIDRMMRFPNANIKTIRANIRLATPDELQKIIKATDNQIRLMARADPDRIDENYIPRNIAWYR